MDIINEQNCKDKRLLKPIMLNDCFESHGELLQLFVQFCLLPVPVYEISYYSEIP